MSCSLRPVGRAQRAQLERLTRATGVFQPEEVAVAVELLDESLAGDDDYRFLGSYAGDELTGYACWGPTPGTRGTYDLYWIAVDKSKHRGGVGKRLLKFAEEEIVRRGGQMLLVETSSQETYGGTIQFYEKTGYDLVGKIKEYYKPGDDKLIFAKRLPLPASTTTSEAEQPPAGVRVEAPDPVLTAG